MINYTELTLFALGIMGVLLHNLVKMNELNKAPENNFTIAKYIMVERFSIIIAFIMVGASVLVSNEIKQLEQAGKWLGLGFLCIGYMGQSLLIKFIGKAEKVIG